MKGNSQSDILDPLVISAVSFLLLVSILEVISVIFWLVES